jgi:hypothetical protein
MRIHTHGCILILLQVQFVYEVYVFGINDTVQSLRYESGGMYYRQDQYDLCEPAYSLFRFWMCHPRLPTPVHYEIRMPMSIWETKVERGWHVERA